MAVEGVLSRRFSLYGSATYLTVNAAYQWQNQNGQLALRAQQARLGLRLYNFLQRGNLAPVGPYQELSLFGLRYRASDLSDRLPLNQPRAWRPFYDLGIGLAIGTHWVLARRWILDLSLRGDWPFNLSQTGTQPLRDQLNQVSVSRLRRLLALRFQVGVGVLL